MAFFSKKKDEQIEVTDLNLPSHIGIIMDGNSQGCCRCREKEQSNE